MASIPRPSRPSAGPPTAALPALPKTRKSTGNIPTVSAFDLSAAPSLPRSGLRAPSQAHNLSLPSSPNLGSGPLPKVRSPGVNSAGRTIRKTISINSFPQPPRGGVRTASMPPSPLVASFPVKASSEDLSNAKPLKLRKQSKVATSPTSNYTHIGAVSFTNGTGDGKSISGGPGARGSDGLLSLPSPPQSRSSSAQDSYSTSATTNEDAVETRGRDSTGDAIGKEGKHEAKGNVIVSVRVRPDVNGGDQGKSEGEWMVDGRRSLVAYRGKEGGDYYYGLCSPICVLSRH